MYKISVIIITLKVFVFNKPAKFDFTCIFFYFLLRSLIIRNKVMRQYSLLLLFNVKSSKANAERTADTLSAT